MHAVAPICVDDQVFQGADGPRLSNKEGPPRRQVRIPACHEALVAVLVLEEVDLNDRIGAGELQLLVDLVGEAGEVAEDRQVLAQLEVSIEDKLRDAQRPLAGCSQGQFFLRLVRFLRRQ